MLEIDGARYSGSGTIVRQAVAFAALTGKSVHIVNVRVRRPKPGLRPQHVQAVEAVRQLVDGSTEGATKGSRNFVFRPGRPSTKSHYSWDIGSAGSITALALAVLPVLAFAPCAVSIELRGGLFQDFAPSYYHLEQVLLPLLGRMGIDVLARMVRPGYVPSGGGILHLNVVPVRATLQPLFLEEPGSVERIWGIALSSKLKHQSVSDRMAESARKIFATAGYEAQIRVTYDDTALQPGAGLAVFADLSSGSRLGSDRAGSPGRSSEAIGQYVARHLLQDLKAEATVDRFAADQVIPFAALASDVSKFRVPYVSEHIASNLWLSEEFLGAKSTVEHNQFLVQGVGFRGRSA